jgi:hypothetical protein
VINQRPDTFMPFQSPLLEIAYRNYSVWENAGLALETSAAEIQGAQLCFTRKVVEAFASGCTPKETYVDKHWNWYSPANQGVFEALYGAPPRIVALERERGDILESFERADPGAYQEREEKLDLILSVRSLAPVGSVRAFPYEEWVTHPERVLREAESWWGLPPFHYNLSELHLDTTATDRILGGRDLHKLRPMRPVQGGHCGSV